jgi:hypothetical protein
VPLIDPAIHDDRTVRTLSQFCSGRTDVREGHAFQTNPRGVEARRLDEGVWVEG